MVYHGWRMLDCDMHCVEPPDLWERYIDPAYKHVAPHGLREFTVDLRVMVQGRTRPKDALIRPPRDKSHVFYLKRSRFKDAEARQWTGEVQLEAMDTEGVDLAVVYPSRGLWVIADDALDPGFAAAIARAYNDWLYDYCQANPRRLLGAAMLSVHDVRDAVDEARRAVEELGFRGVFIRPNPVKGRNWHDPYYEPLWAELERLSVPLGFHEAYGPHLPQVGDRFGAESQMVHTVCHPMEMMLAAVSVIGGGVLERHPNLRVAFLEANCGWVPLILWRLDEHFEVESGFNERVASRLSMRPREYFKRQCWVSVEAEETFVKQVIEAIGDDNIMFSNDWPHIDSKYPDATAHFMKLPISDESKRKILWDNTARYYQIGDDEHRQASARPVERAAAPLA